MFAVFLSVSLEIYVSITSSFSIITPNNMKDSKHHLNFIEVCVYIQFIEHLMCVRNLSKFWHGMFIEEYKINA